MQKPMSEEVAMFVARVNAKKGAIKFLTSAPLEWKDVDPTIVAAIPQPIQQINIFIDDYLVDHIPVPMQHVMAGPRTINHL